jgi:alkylhydroperoxidase family enzyme
MRSPLSGSAISSPKTPGSEEKVLLAMTEEVTLMISKHGLSDETYEKAKTFFSDELIARIIMAVVIINGWNRIAISTRMPVPSSE